MSERPASNPPREVVIDGVRYVPASTAAPGMQDVLRVLADDYLLEGHDPAERWDLRIVVATVGELPDNEYGGVSFDEFAARLMRALGTDPETPTS